MFHTRTAIEYRAGTEAAVLPSIGAADRFAEESSERRLAAEQALDQVLADSFPASDPPSWNPGIVRADPVLSYVEDGVARGEARAADAPGPKSGAGNVIHVSELITVDQSFFERFVSFAGAIGTASLIPLGILLVGLPVAIAVRGLLELIGWAFGIELL